MKKQEKTEYFTLEDLIEHVGEKRLLELLSGMNDDGLKDAKDKMLNTKKYI